MRRKFKEFIEEIRKTREMLNIGKQQITLDRVIEEVKTIESGDIGELRVSRDELRELVKEIIRRCRYVEEEYNEDLNELWKKYEIDGVDVYVVASLKEHLDLDRLIAGYLIIDEVILLDTDKGSELFISC